MNTEKPSSNKPVSQEASLVKPNKDRNLFQESIDGLNQWIVEARRCGEQLSTVSFGNVEVSIQCGSGSYCTPRTDNAEKYTEVELGYPSEQPPEYIMEYIDGSLDRDPTKAVYAYVPIELVARWAFEKGGVKALPAPEEEK